MGDYLRMKLYTDSRGEDLLHAAEQARLSKLAPRKLGGPRGWLFAFTVILLGMIFYFVR